MHLASKSILPAAYLELAAMESRDGALHELASGDLEPSFPSAAARLAAVSAASPLCLVPHDLPPSEALNRHPRVYPSSYSETSSDRLLQDPSCSMAGDLPSSSSKQQQGDICSILPAKTSVDCLRPEFSSSQQISSQSAFLSELPMNVSPSNDDTDEKADSVLHSASPQLETTAEGLMQNPSVERGFHGFSSSDEDSEAQYLQSSTSAIENSSAKASEEPPSQRLSDGSKKEESNCLSEVDDLPDDVKQEMLKEEHKGVAILSCKSQARESHVYLIGTAHVSEESCREVRAVISLMKPEVVFVELCQKRAFILRRQHMVVPTVSDLLSSWKENRTNMLGILYTWFVGKVAAELRILPGSEFRAAYEEAQVWGAKVILGDRDIEVTLRRTWGKMSMWHKTKFIAIIVYHAFSLPKADQLNELIEKLKDNDMITVAFEELGNAFPTLLETLIDERDMFMAAVLQKLGEDSSSIVAVVGRGHIAGIRKHWGEAICTHDLLEIPPRQTIWVRAFKLVGVSAVVALMGMILYLYYR